MALMKKFYPIARFFILFMVIASETRLCHCSSSSSSHGCSNGQREALLKFKQSFEDPSYRLSSWKGMDCCKWEGIYCNKSTGHVLKLDLRSIHDGPNVLEATKLDASLLELRHLNYLDLSGNNFQESRIPKFLGQMKGLKYLNLSYTNFRAVFPPQLGNLTNLQVLDLSDIEHFTIETDDLQEDFEWISTLSSLKHLDMSYVDLSGARNLLHVVNMLPSLSVLSLNWCQLDDSQLLPNYSNLTFFPSIQELNLANNFFKGSSFLHLLKNMTSLRILDLSDNSFNCSIPVWFSNMNNLEYLDLSYNKFSEVEGGLWRILWNLCHLKSFDFSSNNHLLSSANKFKIELLETNKNISGGCMRYDLEALSIHNSRLTGSLPDGLGQFNKLKHLDLSDNALHGPITTSIGTLTALREVYLSGNKLNGPIPASLGNLSALNVLYICCNQLNGAIPKSLGNLLALRQLILSSNQLLGAIPETIGNLSALIEVDISDNQLNGMIPTTIGTLFNLTRLHLSNNQLNGFFPDSIGQLFNLDSLDVSSNSLEGNISEIHFLNLSKLTELRIGSNQLTIKMSPDWVPPFQLNTMNMGSCKIGTMFPQWIRTQKKLKFLVLSNASITGPWPKWFQSSLLTTLDLSHNQISGRIPQNIADLLPALSYLQIVDNHINGTIPSSFCKLDYLLTLDISENMLTGNIPNCWKDTQFLTILKLSFNKLTGVIPSTIGNLSELSWLHLNNNSFKGEIPLSLRNCTRLIVLNLGENQFFGNIPTWLGMELRWLQVLRLRNNMFDGYIPLQLCQLPSLQILDLANNSLMGTIPHCLGNLTGMTMKRSILNYDREVFSSFNQDEWAEEDVAVIIKGKEIKYKNSLRLVVNIDLSSNKLVGIIPRGLTLLSQLLGLNLSNNHLTGSIPKNIGNLTSLESLDLSRNQLSGNIPMGMSLLGSLNYLNLSYNNFSGQIPTGNQLQTLVDPSIYAGNPYLCGTPLQKTCPGHKPLHVPVTTSNEDNDEEDKFDKVWFYLAITTGYGTGLWVVLGILIFKKKWRYAYFRFVDETKDWLHVAITVKVARLKKKIKGGNRSVE